MDGYEPPFFVGHLVERGSRLDGSRWRAELNFGRTNGRCCCCYTRPRGLSGSGGGGGGGGDVEHRGVTFVSGHFYEEIYLPIPDIARDYVFLIEALPVRHIDIFTSPSTHEKRMILSAIVSFVAPRVFVCVWYLCISAMGRRRVSASTPV